MRIDALAVGTRMPAWVDAGVQTYQKRLPRHIKLGFKSLSAETRVRSVSMEKARELEGERLIKAIPPAAHIIALDERGVGWTSVELGQQLEKWLAGHRQIALLIGGADGLAESCKQRADSLWSLSPLTLPHALVRVLIAEQLYRAWTLVQGHPYHRA